MQRPRVLVVTGMYPTVRSPSRGVFVQEQVEALRLAAPSWKIDVLHADVRNGWLARLGKVGVRTGYLVGCLRVLAGSIIDRPDIVHGHYLYGGLMARCQWRAPVIVTFHGSDIMDQRTRGWSTSLARVVDRVIVVSRGMAELLGPRLQHRVDLIPCGIDTAHFAPRNRAVSRARYGMRPDRRYLLFPGSRDRWVKNYPLFRAVVDRLTALGLLIETVVLEDVARADVPAILSACDMLVLTSRWEGSPMVIKEALACGTPIVSVNVGDVAEMLSGVANARVADPDVEILAAAAIDLLDQPDLPNGRERSLTIDGRRTAETVIELYREMLPRPRKSM